MAEGQATQQQDLPPTALAEAPAKSRKLSFIRNLYSTIKKTTSVGSWSRFSTDLVRSLKPRPQPKHRKRREADAVWSERSIVADEQQCGHGVLHLP